MKAIKYIFLLSLFTITNNAIDNPHFYRATYFWGEPRLEFPWLTSFDVTFGGANTKTGYNNNGKKTSLLNIYGPHNMHHLGSNVPNLDPANPLDQILINLNAIPNRQGFGELVFSGKFQIIEAQLNLYQNFTKGFFIQAHIPIRKLKISQIRFQDLSPDDTIFPNKNTPEWQQFLTSFPQILARYNLTLKGANHTGAGDLTILAGWTINYENTNIVDYLDVDSKIGMLFPTGRTTTLRRPFDLPQGYNGFFAVPLKFDLATGLLDWLTLGFHIGALFFLERTKNLRMRTADDQNGFIKLANGKAKVDQGTIWDATGYIKTDHVMKGLSILLGYSYNKKDHDCIAPNDMQIFDPFIANSDNQFKSWRMHTLHFLIEYDFAQRCSDIGLRLGFFYNHVLTGQRIFNAHTKTIYTGIDIAWLF